MSNIMILPAYWQICYIIHFQDVKERMLGSTWALLLFNSYILFSDN
jgi:hypothetical protein